MAFSAFELSEDLGCPVELYEWTIGETGEIYRQTSQDVEVEFMGETFVPYELDRDTISLDPSKSLTINTDKNHVIAQKLIGFPAGTLIHLTIRRIHAVDLSPIITWRGRIKRAEFNGNTADIIADPKSKSLKKSAFRVSYSAGCNNILYSPQTCGVDKEDFKHSNRFHQSYVPGSDHSGYTLYFASSTTNMFEGFVGGFVKRVSNGDVRMITAVQNDKTEVKIIAPFSPALQDDEDLELYPGCDLSLSTCKNKFNNLNNFGGFPFIPSKNPFSEEIN